MSASPFRWRHRVIYAECTVGNHLYHARYLDVLEAARGELFRSLGVPLAGLQEADTVFPVVECQVSYRRPARYDEELTIEVWITCLNRLRVNFGYRIVNGNGAVVVEARTEHVCATCGERPKRMPPELVEKLRPHVREVELVG